MKFNSRQADANLIKALAKLVDGDDDSYSLTYPVVRLSLVEEKFLRNESLDMPEDCSPINTAFHYLGTETFGCNVAMQKNDFEPRFVPGR